MHTVGLVVTEEDVEPDTDSVLVMVPEDEED